MRQVLRPANVNPTRRIAMLTVALLQLVASRKGIATLPAWAIQPYLDRKYTVTRTITKNGLHCKLYTPIRDTSHQAAYMREFIQIMRQITLRNLDDIELLD